ncbi:hypothetical protein Ddye_006631 [Dipteronia dyeriana]|uniref:BZIP domain-containing protein n=1 Tax=Dipteronia dyeriana TaxID=168575 RepID=A0AAD9XJE7_9ROSI|nr:hypothetical protein Ddye_006631 [Dipteronia dyeriana]
MFFSEEDQLPVLNETGFNLTTDEIEELLSIFQTGDDTSSVIMSPNSGSEGSNRGVVYSVDERKKRRMLSNRESARRSRWRKKRHLENMTEQVKQLKVENRELKNQYSFILNQCHLLWTENELLTSEYVALCARLSHLCQILRANHPNY